MDESLDDKTSKKEPTHLDYYRALISMADNMVATDLSRFYNFLMANSILVLAWATVFSSTSSIVNPKIKILVLISICLLGVIGGPAWSVVARRGSGMWTYYRAAAACIENPGKNLNDFFDNEVVETNPGRWQKFLTFIKLNRYWQILVSFVLLDRPRFKKDCPAKELTLKPCSSTIVLIKEQLPFSRFGNRYILIFGPLFFSVLFVILGVASFFVK